VGDGGAIKITTCGKNLLPYPYDRKLEEGEITVNGCTITANTDGSIKVSGASSAQAAVELVDLILPSGSYIFTTGIDEIIEGCYFQLNTTVNGAWGERVARPGLEDTYTRLENERFTLTKTTSLRVKLYFAGSKTYNHVFYPMIRLNSITDTTFEPYISSSVTLNTPNGLKLPGIPVTSGGNYTDANGRQWICDEVDFEKGVYIQRVDTILLDGVANRFTYKSTTTNTNSYRIAVNDSKIFMLRTGGDNEKPAIFSDRFTTISFNERNAGAVGININVQTHDENTIWCTFGTNGPATLTEANTWLAENNTTVMYALPAPNYIYLSDIDPNILAQYATLHTNYPNTTIFNDGGADMEVQYATPSTVLPLSGGRMNGSIDMVNHQLTGLPIPKNNTDAVSLEYLQETNLELAKGIDAVSGMADKAQETADEAHERIDDS
jgi:hypothetical protein